VQNLGLELREWRSNGYLCRCRAVTVVNLPFFFLGCTDISHAIPPQPLCPCDLPFFTRSIACDSQAGRSALSFLITLITLITSVQAVVGNLENWEGIRYIHQHKQRKDQERPFSYITQRTSGPCNRSRSRIDRLHHVASACLEALPHTNPARLDLS
jgi:hypothetical protein